MAENLHVHFSDDAIEASLAAIRSATAALPTQAGRALLDPITVAYVRWHAEQANAGAAPDDMGEALLTAVSWLLGQMLACQEPDDRPAALRDLIVQIAQRAWAAVERGPIHNLQGDTGGHA